MRTGRRTFQYDDAADFRRNGAAVDYEATGLAERRRRRRTLTPPTPPGMTEAARRRLERRRAVHFLRAAGMTAVEIGYAMGITPVHVRRLAKLNGQLRACRALAEAAGRV
jgi:hypothetical protein